MPPSCSVAVLAKAPLPGYAKTRLRTCLGDAGAARLQEELVTRAVRTALAAGVGRVRLWCAPDASHPFFRQLAAETGVALAAQTTGDLGARMLHCAAASLAAASAVILTGSDCPVMTPNYLHGAAAALADHDVVIGPAEDGGYVLLGLRRSHASLFTDMRWGDGRVLAETRQRLADLGWRYHTLATLWDLDTPADLRRWHRTMAQS